MSIFRCCECDRVKDSDYEICRECGIHSQGLICLSCVDKMEEAYERLLEEEKKENPL